MAPSSRELRSVRDAIEIVQRRLDEMGMSPAVDAMRASAETEVSERNSA